MLQDGPDIVSFGLLGLNLMPVTDSTPTVKLGSPLYLGSRVRKLAENQCILVSMTLLGDWQVCLGNCDFFPIQLLVALPRPPTIAN